MQTLNSLPSSISEIIYRPPQTDRAYSVRFNGASCDVCDVSDGTTSLLKASVERSEETGAVLHLKVNPLGLHEEHGLALGICLDFLFSHGPEIESVIVTGAQELVGHLPALSGLLESKIHGNNDSDNEIHVSRSRFYQLPYFWHQRGFHHHQQPSVSAPETWITTAGRRHPERPRFGAGTHYKRYVPTLEKTISFRTIDIEKDLGIFHEWHNQPRVYALWELNKPIEELKDYLEKGLADAHQTPMIMEFDGEPVGYFEIYWAAEDRIAPYYEYEPHDRGFHFLIGNPKYLGLANTDAALKSVAHFIYLDEARTHRIVAEPRSDNKLVLKYARIVPGWHFIKEFDFPHKRAALLMNRREDFFGGKAL